MCFALASLFHPRQQKQSEKRSAQDVDLNSLLVPTGSQLERQIEDSGIQNHDINLLDLLSHFVRKGFCASQRTHVENHGFDDIFTLHVGLGFYGCFGGSALGGRACGDDDGRGAEAHEVNSGGKTNATRGTGDEDFLALEGTGWWERLKGEFVAIDELWEAEHLEAEFGVTLELTMMFERELERVQMKVKIVFEQGLERVKRKVKASSLSDGTDGTDRETIDIVLLYPSVGGFYYVGFSFLLRIRSNRHSGLRNSARRVRISGVYTAAINSMSDS